jgi:hypothetical protein
MKAMGTGTATSPAQTLLSGIPFQAMHLSCLAEANTTLIPT